jgi:hypothetical protein
MSHLIAMWSGPRNISTALMRSWESRPDTIVHDEPFYAYYLANSPYKETHPSAEEIIAAYESDWRKVAAQLTAPLPQNVEIYYQKHMTHHMLEEIDLAWLLPLKNCFLIRDPRQVLISLAKVIPNPHIDQTGFPQQLRLFHYIQQRKGKTPPVIDSKTILLNPRHALTRLCEALEVPFREEMLQWPAGKRASDGIWAKYWYAGVEQSTGFMPYQDSDDPLPAHLTDLLATCNVLYSEIAQFQLT